MVVFDDRSTIGLYRDRQENYQEISRYSKKDADTYLRFAETAMKYLPMISASFYTPPPPMGAMLAMLDQSPEGRELFLLMQKSPYDIILDNFENEKVRLFLVRWSPKISPARKRREPAWESSFFSASWKPTASESPWGQRRSFGIPHPLHRSPRRRSSQQHFGRAGPGQKRSRHRRAHRGRNRYAAKDGVIGSLHPHFLGRYVPGVEARITRDAERVELSANSCFTVHGALNEPLRFKAGPHVSKSYFTDLVPSNMTVLRQYFDALRYGRIPDSALLGIACPSNFDPTRCPPGKSTFHIWDYVPYSHPDGGPSTGQAKDAFAQTMIERTAKFCKTSFRKTSSPTSRTARLTSNVVPRVSRGRSARRRTLSLSIRRAPTDARSRNEHRARRRPALSGRTVPASRWRRIGAGRATAMKMCEDLKINFDKIGQQRS